MNVTERLAELHAEADELMRKMNTVSVLAGLMEDALNDIRQTAEDIQCNVRWCEQDLDKAGD